MASKDVDCMRGVYAKLQADTLAAALAPVAARAAQLAWAVDLYSGPLIFPYWDEENPQNVLTSHHQQPGLPMGWFTRGFLPRNSHTLVLDEFSYYLGFDPDTLAPAELARQLTPRHSLGPQPPLFDVVAAHDLVYIVRVATRWWEAYTRDPDLLEQLQRGWDGQYLESNDRDYAHPAYRRNPDLR
jgi:hypothetical protein